MPLLLILNIYQGWIPTEITKFFLAQNFSFLRTTYFHRCNLHCYLGIMYWLQFHSSLRISQQFLCLPVVFSFDFLIRSILPPSFVNVLQPVMNSIFKTSWAITLSYTHNLNEKTSGLTDKLIYLCSNTLWGPIETGNFHSNELSKFSFQSFIWLAKHYFYKTNNNRCIQVKLQISQLLGIMKKLKRSEYSNNEYKITRKPLVLMSLWLDKMTVLTYS